VSLSATAARNSPGSSGSDGPGGKYPSPLGRHRGPVPAAGPRERTARGGLRAAGGPRPRRASTRSARAGAGGLVPCPTRRTRARRRCRRAGARGDPAGAGNHRARALLVELSWSWIRLQPTSALTQWFNRRFATGGKRMRRVGIVALARRLAIALWRYLQNGEIPEGAVLKSVIA